jgi:hypothetical protein
VLPFSARRKGSPAFCFKRTPLRAIRGAAVYRTSFWQRMSLLFD